MSVTLLYDPGSALKTWRSLGIHVIYQTTIAVEYLGDSGSKLVAEIHDGGMTSAEKAILDKLCDRLFGWNVF